MSAQTSEDDLVELRELAQEIIGYVDSWRKEDYLRDRMKQRALERTMELLGEVATRLGDAVPDRDVDWRGLRALRVKLAHAYQDVDPGRLWIHADVDVRRLHEAL